MSITITPDIVSIVVLWICYFVIAVMVALVARRLYRVELIRHTVIPRACAELGAVFFLAAVVRYFEASAIAFHWPRTTVWWVHGVIAFIVSVITIDLWFMRIPLIRHIQLVANIDFVKKWFITGKRIQQRIDIKSLAVVMKAIWRGIDEL